MENFDKQWECVQYVLPWITLGMLLGKKAAEEKRVKMDESDSRISFTRVKACLKS